MRRMICLIGVLMLCMMLAMPAFATNDTFVPSISYKDGPEVEDATQNGEDVDNCVVVTSVKGAKEKTTDIYQEERDLLLKVYEELDAGTMELPLENKNYVVRELVDVSFVKSDCVEGEHGHEEDLSEQGTTIELVMDLGIKSTTGLEVLVYVDGEWIHVESVKNNGDGTVTCVFEDIGIVAFCVDADAEDGPPKTGDVQAEDLGMWAMLMAVTATALVLVVVNRRKILG